MHQAHAAAARLAGDVRLVLGPAHRALSAVPIGLLYSAIPVWHVFDSGVAVDDRVRGQHVAAHRRRPGVCRGRLSSHIRSGVFHVEDGCAGLHYFIVAATIAVLYGELRGDGSARALWLFVLAIALALASNWLRVFIIIVAGLSDRHAAATWCASITPCSAGRCLRWR